MAAFDIFRFDVQSDWLTFWVALNPQAVLKWWFTVIRSSGRAPDPATKRKAWLQVFFPDLLVKFWCHGIAIYATWTTWIYMIYWWCTPSNITRLLIHQYRNPFFWYFFVIKPSNNLRHFTQHPPDMGAAMTSPHARCWPSSVTIPRFLMAINGCQQFSFFMTTFEWYPDYNIIYIHTIWFN